MQYLDPQQSGAFVEDHKPNSSLIMEGFGFFIFQNP